MLPFTFFNTMKFCLSLIALTLFSTSKAKHPHDSNLSVEGDTLLFRIEIPAGTKQKWEFNFETGEMEKDYKDGKERIIQFLPYPGNYGFIPETLAGDGDPIDVIDLDEAGERGELRQVRILGSMDFLDGGDEDLKVIGIDPEGIFGEVQSIDQLALKKPAVLEILKTWFCNYKKSGKMVFRRFIDREETEAIL